MKNKSDYNLAVAQLRMRIDEQARRLGEVAQVLDDLFAELDALEAEMEASLPGISDLQGPGEAANSTVE